MPLLKSKTIKKMTVYNAATECNEHHNLWFDHKSNTGQWQPINDDKSQCLVRFILLLVCDYLRTQRNSRIVQCLYGNDADEHGKTHECAVFQHEIWFTQVRPFPCAIPES